MPLMLRYSAEELSANNSHGEQRQLIDSLLKN